MTIEELWWLSLGVFGLVTVVVAILLGLILAAARRIGQHAEGIWTVGKEIAGNTVSVWLLERTNDLLEDIRDSAAALERGAASLGEMLRTLPRGRA